MLQHEFEELTGFKVSEAEYENIEMVYMDYKDMDKQEFYKMWKKLPDNAKDMMIKMARDKNRTINDGRVAVQELLNEKRRILEVMFERTQKMSDHILRNECIKHMGIKAYLTKMLEDGYILWSIDKEALVEFINK